MPYISKASVTVMFRAVSKIFQFNGSSWVLNTVVQLGCCPAEICVSSGLEEEGRECLKTYREVKDIGELLQRLQLLLVGKDQMKHSNPI